MKTFQLLGEAELPVGFVYPREFERAVQLGLTNLEPWHLLEGDDLRRTFAGLQERFRDRTLIPFASRQDNDDIACWDTQQGQSVLVVHDFASPGWEHRGRFESFWDWFRRAIEEMIDFDS